jgi:hypothetical protein
VGILCLLRGAFHGANLAALLRGPVFYFSYVCFGGLRRRNEPFRGGFFMQQSNNIPFYFEACQHSHTGCIQLRLFRCSVLGAFAHYRTVSGDGSPGVCRRLDRNSG